MRWRDVLQEAPELHIVTRAMAEPQRKCTECKSTARFHDRGYFYCGEHYPPTRPLDDDEVRRFGKLFDRDRMHDLRGEDE